MTDEAVIVEPLAPGVYFGLDADTYLDDPALGSGDMRRLYTDPPGYWWRSPYNPERPERKERQDLHEGRAFHVMLLEGAEVFTDRYIIEPEKHRIANLLVTVQDMKDWLKKRGHTGTGQKRDIMHQIRALNKNVRFWDDVLSDFRELCETKNLEPIKQDLSNHVRAAAEHIRLNPNLEHVFGKGVPEVTVVWDDKKVRLKARIDFLRVRPVIDLKTIRKPTGYSTFDAHVFREMRIRRHDIQAYHLLEARHEAAAAIADGRVYGEAPSDEWLKAVRDETDYAAYFVYYQKDQDSPPIAKAYEFKPDFGPMTLASENWREGYYNFHKFRNRFGLDDMWVNYDGVHTVLMDQVHKI